MRDFFTAKTSPQENKQVDASQHAFLLDILERDRNNQGPYPLFPQQHASILLEAYALGTKLKSSQFIPLTDEQYRFLTANTPYEILTVQYHKKHLCIDTINKTPPSPKAAKTAHYIHDMFFFGQAYSVLAGNDRQEHAKVVEWLSSLRGAGYEKQVASIGRKLHILYPKRFESFSDVFSRT